MPYINPLFQPTEELVIFSKRIILCISQKGVSQHNSYNRKAF